MLSGTIKWLQSVHLINPLPFPQRIFHVIFAPSFLLVKCCLDLSVCKNQQKAFPFLLKDWLQEARDHNEKKKRNNLCSKHIKLVRQPITFGPIVVAVHTWFSDATKQISQRNINKYINKWCYKSDRNTCTLRENFQ